MRYVALATDYDGTLAHDGRVPASAVAALERLAGTGRKLLLVTGRELPDLRRLFPPLELFDRVVAENGALLLDPATGETRALAPPPPPAFVSELELRGVTPLCVGASIVATRHPHERTALEVIRELGLELQVTFNKGAVMVLPAGINKASGLASALEELHLSPHNVVAIGDAENDHALLALAECSVAVANAVPLLADSADRKTRGENAAGVEELIEALMANDLADVVLRRKERALLLGTCRHGTELHLPAAGLNLLVTGTSGSGKSTLATGLLEQLIARHYQCCVIDPEGDYDELADVIVFGGPQRAPGVSEIMTALDQPAASVSVNLLGVTLADRPAFFAKLLLRLQELRTRLGRPHWILVDEAHHLLPADWQAAPEILSEVLSSVIYVTVHPDSLSDAVLRKIDAVAAVGESPDRRVAAVQRRRGMTPPSALRAELEAGEALIWLKDAPQEAAVVQIAPSHGERRRHQRKYAEGELGPDRSFYFRGPREELNLRAQNLVLFTQIAAGVDPLTWLHHLRNADYSCWIEGSIKDPELAADVREVERQADHITAAESLERIRAAIEARYTLPATAAAAAAAAGTLHSS